MKIGDCKVTKLYYIYKDFQVKKCRSNDFHQFKRHDKQTLNITMKEKSSIISRCQIIFKLNSFQSIVHNCNVHFYNIIV